MTSLERMIISAARRWYHSGGNAEAELAALIQEYEEQEREADPRGLTSHIEPA